MHLMYWMEDGERRYTLLKKDPNGCSTKSAHPTKFSPDDKFSKQRNDIYRRFKLLPGQSHEGCTTLAEHKKRTAAIKTEKTAGVVGL